MTTEGGWEEEGKWIAKASKEDVKPVQKVDVRLCCLFDYFLIRATEMPTVESWKVYHVQVLKVRCN